MSWLTAEDIPPWPPSDPLDDAHPHMQPLDPLFRPVLDEALRNGKGARPDNVHIPTTKRWRLT